MEEGNYEAITLLEGSDDNDTGEQLEDIHLDLLLPDPFTPRSDAPLPVGLVNLEKAMELDAARRPQLYETPSVVRRELEQAPTSSDSAAAGEAGSNESAQSRSAPVQPVTEKDESPTLEQNVVTRIDEQLENRFQLFSTKIEDLLSKRLDSTSDNIRQATKRQLEDALAPIQDNAGRTMLRVSKLESASMSIPPEVEAYVDKKIETSFANAWGNGTLNTICREALDSALREVEFVTQLGTAFLRTSTLHSALSDLTKRLALVEVRGALRQAEQERRRTENNNDREARRAPAIAQPSAPATLVQASDVSSTVPKPEVDYAQTREQDEDDEHSDPEKETKRPRSKKKKKKEPKSKSSKQEETSSKRVKSEREGEPDGSDPDSSSSEEDDEDDKRRRKQKKRNKNKRKSKKKKKSKREPETSSSSSDDTDSSSSEEESEDEEEDDTSDDKVSTKRRLLQLQANQEKTLAVRRPLMDEFAAVIAWTAYRLNDRNPVYTVESARTARKKHKDMKSYVGETFSGKEPVAILEFLRRFANACNQFKIPEGNAVWLITEFTTGRARKAVEQMIGVPADVDKTGTPHLATYISVVHRLINRFATDSNLSQAYCQLTSIQQKPNETCIQLQERICDKAKLFVDALPTRHLVKIYIEGVHDSLRKDVNQRWIDETKRLKLDTVSDSNAFEVAENERIMFDDLASYAESQRDEQIAAIEVTKTKPKETRVTTVTPVTTTTTVAAVETPPPHYLTPSPSSSTSSLPSLQGRRNAGNGSGGAYYNQGRNTGYGNRRNDNQNYPVLASGYRYKTPPGYQCLLAAIREFINPGPACRICNKPKTAQEAHETSECPHLSDDIVKRYWVLAERLLNLYSFRRAVEQGRYPPISLNQTGEPPQKRLLLTDNPRSHNAAPTTSTAPPPAAADTKIQEK